MRRTIDRPFLISVILLVLLGIFAFYSASLGILARESDLFKSVVFNQIVLGLVGGTIVAWFASKIDFHFWRKHAFFIFISSLVLTTFVFIPGIGFEHGGAKRWIDLGFMTFQPSEFLKIGTLIYLSAWYSGVRQNIHKFSYGLLPLLIVLGIVGFILLNEPNTSTFVVISIASLGVLIVGGGRIRDIVILGVIGAIIISMWVSSQPYIQERIQTFLNPSSDPLGSSYQIQQSLIAIGSGEIFGRGLGQSVQKFNFLPEPMGDSIFAVFSEEFGFVGSVILVLLFTNFAVQGLRIASKTDDYFGRLLATGIVILIIFQSFMNIAAMIGIIPLSGLPLLFVSQGGTALFSTLFAVGIIMNISKHTSKS